MPSSKDREVDAVDDRPRDKPHRSKSERKDRERDREKDKERRRERDKDRERDRDADRDKDSLLSSAHRHTYTSYRSSRSSKLRPTDSDTTSRSHRRHRTRDMDRDEQDDGSVASRSMADLVPELSRVAGSERENIPYPSFSKAHSKEALHSKEDLSTSGARRMDPLTPDTTDLGGSEMRRSKSADSPPITRKASTARKESRQDDRPPSPPETDLSAQKKRPGTPASVKEAEDP
jgi:hypothetical protein